METVYKKKEKAKGSKEAEKYIRDGAGRFNNLLSLVHAIAVFTEKVQPMKLVYDHFRSSVSKIHPTEHKKFKYT